MNPVRLPNFVVDISAKNNELLAQFSHRQSRKFRSEADDEFVDEEWKKIKLSFTRDMADKVTGLVLRNIRMTYYFDDKHNVFSRMVPGETEVSARRLELPAPTITGNTTFVLKGYPNARIVALAGSFNDWNQSQTLFAREADRWVCRIDLPQGRYGYKFVVDGAWITDPGNPETEDDGHGNYNSVLDLPSAKH